MDKPRNNFPNKTAKFFYRLSLLTFWTGQPNFWIDNLAIPKRFASPYRFFSRTITIFVYAFIVSEFAAIITQKNLTKKQESDLMIYVMSHPMLWSYSVSFCTQTDKVKKILVNILALKQVYNDAGVEKRMMKKSTYYSSAFAAMCGVSMSIYTFDAILLVLKKEGTFTTIITAWPLVDDTSTSANILRIMWNMLWWIMMSRVLSVYAFVFSLTSCMSHQFIDLQNYFNSLDNIFKNNRWTQKQKELKYEEGYKVGIKLHYGTLECVELSKTICGWLFSGQIIFNVTMLVILITQLMNADLMHAGAIVLAAFSILLATGLIMCNAGDVTVEASTLCTAIYSSGWQHCQGQSSARIRKLVVTSMVFAQRPVVMKGLGIMHLSYQSYVSLVKSTYSVFSLVFNEVS